VILGTPVLDSPCIADSRCGSAQERFLALAPLPYTKLLHSECRLSGGKFHNRTAMRFLKIDMNPKRNLLLCFVSVYMLFAPNYGEADNSIFALYSCARRVKTASGLNFGGFHRFIPLGTEMFALYTRSDGNGDIILYTPSFAGQTNIKEGGTGNTMSADGKSYNVRIPYQPSSENEKGGFYYLTANSFNVGVNFPPRFLPGKAQKYPDFSKMSKRAGVGVTVTLLSIGGKDLHAKSTDEFYPLKIEHELWHTSKVSPEAREALKTYVIANLPKIADELESTMHARIRGMRFAGGAKDVDVTRFKAEAIQDYESTIKSCTTAASKQEFAQIKEALELLPQGLEF